MKLKTKDNATFVSISGEFEVKKITPELQKLIDSKSLTIVDESKKSKTPIMKEEKK